MSSGRDVQVKMSYEARSMGRTQRLRLATSMSESIQPTWVYRCGGTRSEEHALNERLEAAGEGEALQACRVAS